MTAVACRDRFETSELIGSAVTNSDEDAGRERNGQFPSRLERGEPTGRHLVGRVAVCFQIRIDRFDHHSLTRRKRPQPGEFVSRQCHTVGVRQQSSLSEDQFRHFCDVMHSRVIAAFTQPVAGHLVAIFWAFPECEQRLVAALPRSLTSDLEDIVGFQKELLHPSGRLCKRAVPARVVAQPGERDEHLRAVRDACTKRLVATCRGQGHQVLQWFVEQRMVSGGVMRCGHEVLRSVRKWASSLVGSRWRIA